MTIFSDIAIDFGDNDFLLPYFEREFASDKCDDAPPTDVALIALRAAVRIISDATADSADKEFEETCQRNCLPLLTLRCPHIVGTGMGGYVRQIAEKIYKGSYVHIKGNDSRISVVHAVDVARAARIAAGDEAEYVLTDSTDPQIYNLSEALAYRIDNKRIFTASPLIAKLWLGKKFYKSLLEHHTASDTFGAAYPDFTPENVVNYLRTHNYDESSL